MMYKLFRRLSYLITKRLVGQQIASQPVKTAWIQPFCRLAIANTTSHLMVPLAGLIDTAFLGHLDDVRYLNGVAVATIIFNVIYWSFNFFRMGTTGPTAQAIGKAAQTKDDSEVWLIVLRNSLLALMAGLSIWLLKEPIAALGFTLLNTGGGIKSAAVDFYNGRIIGAPAVLVNYVLLGWMLGRSQGRQVVILAVIGNFSNVVLDYGFIVQLGWDSYGAGLATAMSQYIMLVTALGLIFAGGIPSQLWPRIKPKLWQLTALKELFGLNRDILIRTFALVISMSLFTSLSAALGDTVLGVNTLLIQVVLMAAYFMDGIALAVESYAGNFYGKRAVADLYWLLVFGIVGSVALGCAIALSLIILPGPFFSLLTIHTSLLEQIPHYVTWLLPVLSLGGIAFTLDGYFLGLTDGKTLRNATLLAALFGFLPLALLAKALHSPHLLWFALTGLMATRAITLIFQVPHTLKPSRPN